MLQEATIHRMVTFLIQEANELVDEINAKGLEAYNLYLAKEVNLGKLKIDQQMKKRIEEVKRRKIVETGQKALKFKQQCVKEAQAHLESLREDVYKSVENFCRSNKKYLDILKKLILQALLMILQRRVCIRVLRRDVECVKYLYPSLISEFQVKTGKKIFLMIDPREYLPEEAIGGVVVFSARDRISIDNTLKARLERLFQQQLPYIKGILFAKK